MSAQTAPQSSAMRLRLSSRTMSASMQERQKSEVCDQKKSERSAALCTLYGRAGTESFICA